MVMFKLMETNNYEELNQLFIKNGLEFSEEDPVPTDLVKSWRVVDEGKTHPKLIGGIMLAKRQDEFIIDGIAIEPEYRKQNLGKMLLDETIKEARKLSGDSIYLVARAPGFFRTQGFENVPKEDAPLFFECLTCSQHGVSCHPEVMKLNI
jgi:N-acetylglutamate synthase-like GNAT family acetyltransferase